MEQQNVVDFTWRDAVGVRSGIYTTWNRHIGSFSSSWSLWAFFKSTPKNDSLSSKTRRWTSFSVCPCYKCIVSLARVCGEWQFRYMARTKATIIIEKSSSFEARTDSAHHMELFWLSLANSTCATWFKSILEFSWSRCIRFTWHNAFAFCLMQCLCSAGRLSFFCIGFCSLAFDHCLNRLRVSFVRFDL